MPVDNHYFLAEYVPIDDLGGISYLEGETAYCRAPLVDVYLKATKDPERRSGSLVLTTHRLVYINDKQKHLSMAWRLSCIGMVGTDMPSFMALFSHPRLRFQAKASDELVAAMQAEIDAIHSRRAGEACAKHAASSSSGFAPAMESKAALPKHIQEPLDMRISFVRGDVTEFQEFLHSALNRKAWIRVSHADLASEAAAAALQEAETSGNAMGLGMIRSQHRARLQLESNVAGEAFRDLSSLMRLAKEVAVLAQQYASTRRDTRAAAAGAGRAGVEASRAAGDVAREHDRAVGSAVEGLGLVNPVTREVAGNRYHQELSVQMAKFAAPVLAHAGGILPLTDLYCLYNRARGTDLVSPDDLLKACQLMEGTGTGMRLHRLASGVLVVQDEGKDDGAIARQLVQWMGNSWDVYVSAPMLAMQLKVSITIAQAHLLHAEKMGVICRDEGLHGLRYFRVPVGWRRQASPG